MPDEIESIPERIMRLAKDEFLLYEGKVPHVERKDALVRWKGIATQVDELKRERNWLVELAAGISQIVETGSTERVSEAWIAMSTDLQKEINFRDSGDEGEVTSGPLPYTDGKFGP